MIVARTPYRVSFFGGGTDYPAWFSKHGGAVLVSAIDKYVYVTMRYQPQFFKHISRVCWSKVEVVSNNREIENPAIRGVMEYFNKLDVGFEIHHQGDLPARSGMGSSSSFIVGLLNAHWALTEARGGLHDLSWNDLQRDMAHRISLAKTAIRIEREYVGDEVGVQDQYAAALGGVHLLQIDKDGEVYPHGLWRGAVDELNANLLLIFLGTTRHASEIAKAQVAEMGEHTSEMARMCEQAQDGYRMLTKQSPMSDFPMLLNEAWRLKRKLSPVISNPEIERVRDGILANGAIGAKIIGAGGGGFVLVYVRPVDRHGLIEWAREEGLTPVPFKFDYTGSEILLRDR